MHIYVYIYIAEEYLKGDVDDTACTVSLKFEIVPFAIFEKVIFAKVRLLQASLAVGSRG